MLRQDDPEDTFDDQPIVDLVATRGMLWWKEQGMQILPLLIAEGCQPNHLPGRREHWRNERQLRCASRHMRAFGPRLMHTPEA